MKKICSLFLVFAMVITIFSCVPLNALAVSDGTCGDNLTWSYDGNGTLTISGTGKMTDYSYYENKAPWSDYYGSVTSVIIADGVTSIGDYALAFCSKLTSIIIPSSVTSIGNCAFAFCSVLTNITLPNSVKSIGNSAFSSCMGLTSVIIPSSVMNIGDNAFLRCSGLTSITISNGVKSLGSYAFEFCSGLTSVTIPNSVNSIGNNAFDGCSGLTSITIPSSLTSIEYGAFRNCSKLTSIAIPKSVTSIGNSAFENCSSLKNVYYTGSEQDKSKISIGSGNIPLTDATWYYLSHSGTCGENVAWNIYNDGTLIISGTGKMTDYSYYENKAPWSDYYGSVTSVIIADGVTSIGDYAFYECSRLTSVTIPNSVTNIGYAAFFRCRGLTSIEIPNSVTSIGSSTFSGCTGLTNIEIPNSVTYIGDYAFSNCAGITNISVGLGNAKYYSKNNCLIEMATKTLMLGCKNSVIPTDGSVTSIGSGAFNGCSGLTSITIPNSVTSIEGVAFEYCTGLTSITIPNSITCIEAWTFNGCTGLKSITIQTSVTSIGSSAFRGCTGLTSITIPNSVTSIGNYAFYDCTGLTSITIPNSVTSIGNRAFYNCSNLQYSIYDNAKYLGNSENPYAFLIETTNKNITSCKINPNTKLICNYAFEYCTGLTSITIPNSVTNIGNSAFFGCNNLIYNKYDNAYYLGNESNPYVVLVKPMSKNITSCVINDNTKVIYCNAFYDCTGLKSIEIPNSVTSIESDAFSNCSSLKNVYYTGSEQDKSKISIGSGNTYLTNATWIYNYSTDIDSGDCGDNVKWSLGEDYVLTISGTGSMTGYEMDQDTGITTAPWGKYSNEIKTVVIVDGVTTVGNDAFAGCSAIEDITIGKDVVSMGYGILFGCSSLKSITVPKGVTSIGEYPFVGCSSLESISVESGNTKYKSNGNCLIEISTKTLIFGCKTSVIPSDGSVEIIGSDAFSNCQLATNLVIPSGIKIIDDYAFYECTGIKSLTLPSGVVSIGIGAFFGCTTLETVSLPVSLKTIKGGAFNYCSAIKDVYYPSTEKQRNEITLESYNSCLVNATWHYNYTSVIDSGTCGDNLSWILYESGTLIISGTGNMTGYEMDQDTGITSAPWGVYFSKIKTVVINDGVTNVGNDAFAGCSAIESITFGKGITSFGYGILFGCSSLKSITIPKGVTSIGEYPFVGCSSLESISVESGNTKYKSKGNCLIEISTKTLIFGCKTSVIPSDGSVEIIGSDAFSNCQLATNLVIPSGIKIIDDYAFYECTGIKSLTLPSGVVSIGTGAFFGCITLETIHLPLSIKAIGGGAFNYCSAIKKVYYPGSVEQRNQISLDGYNAYLVNATWVFSHNHSYGDWVIKKESTIFAVGEKYHICSTCGHKESAEIPVKTVDINGGEYGLAKFTIVNAQSLSPIKNASIYVSVDGIGQETFFTDQNGNADIVLPIGKHTVSCYADNCLVRNITVDIKSGENVIPNIGLSAKNIYDTKLTSKEMTIDEIKEAGIDTTATENQHVYKYELKLDYQAQSDLDNIVFYRNGDGKVISSSGGYSGGGGGGSGYSGGGGSSYYWVPDLGTPSGGYIYIPSKTPSQPPTAIYPVSENFYFIIRGGTRWLKEMFDVEMLVINNSNTDTLESISASLSIPNGLSLATMVGDEQKFVQTTDVIKSGASKSFHWYLRGDEAGSYNINASLNGVIMPFGEIINDSFTLENPIEILAGDALHLDFEFPNAVYSGEDYPITVTLENVSDKTIYNLENMVDFTQGYKVYYSDGTTKEVVKTSDDLSFVMVDGFEPGDKIIVETTVNVLFKSEVMESKIKSWIGFIDGAEELINAYRAVKNIIEVPSSVSGVISLGLESLNDIITSTGLQIEKAKLEATKDLYSTLSNFYTSYIKTKDYTIDSANRFSSSDIMTALKSLNDNPAEYIASHTLSDINSLINKTEALIKSIEAKKDVSKFNVFDSLRTAISSVPIRFILTSAVLSENINNTTSIPCSFHITNTPKKYSGVSNVSKYLDSIATVLSAQLIKDNMPWYMDLITDIDDTLGTQEAINYIYAVENEITSFKAKDSTGQIKYKAWVEKGEDGSSNFSPSDFTLTTDNETSQTKDNVLSFTGDGTINIVPNNKNGGVLNVEDEDGNLYSYTIVVVDKHTCDRNDKNIILHPTEGYNGVAVDCCSVCGQVTAIRILSIDDCNQHSFGEWKTEIESSCTQYGVKTRTCSNCGYMQIEYLDMLEHTFSNEFTVDKEPTVDSTGIKSRHCIYCDAVTDETKIPKLLLSGKCGENATWEFSATTKTITISGTGVALFDSSSSFKNMADLIENVVVSEGITEISQDLFKDLNKLKNVSVSNTVAYIGKNAFENCVGLTEIEIPDCVLEIGENTFKGCTKLANVINANQVLSVDKGAFDGCISLQTIALQSVVYIGEESFKGCTKINNVRFGDDIACIDDNAFDGCSQFVSIVIPETIGYISDTAFANCEKVSMWYNFGEEIPETLRDMGIAQYVGDFNGDYALNAEDIAMLVDSLLGETSVFEDRCGDFNGDGTFNILDLVSVKKTLANGINSNNNDNPLPSPAQSVPVKATGGLS